MASASLVCSPPESMANRRSPGLMRRLRSEERRVGKEWRSLCDWSSDVCSSDLLHRLQAQDCLGEYLPAVRVHGVSGLVEDTELKPAELLDHRQRHGERELGLLAAREHGESALTRTDAKAEIGRASCRERVEITV